MRDNHSLSWVLGGLAVVAVVVLLWVPWWLAEHVSDAEPVPGHPVAVVVAVVRGDPAWPAEATWWAVAMGVLLAGVAGGLAWLWWLRPVDRAARRLPRDWGLRRYRTGTGPRIGRVVRGLVSVRRPTIRATNEDQIVVVAGPRTGKTTALAIPAAVEHAVGPLVVTSNKRDIYDAIVGLRTEVGQVWLFDPLGLASDGQPRWWWNPLRLARDIRGARRLAAIWAKEARDPGDTGHAFFDPESQELLAGMLLAAARGDRTMSQVYRWLTKIEDREPVEVLESAGCELAAAGLEGRRTGEGQIAASLYAGARRLVPWLDDAKVLAWIEPGTASVELVPSRFAAGNETLVSLSQEGAKWATALVTALTASVLTDAEAIAAKRPGGRLEHPMLGVLDEAANVCRWKELPDLYSHYGSRGIVLMSIFQSWAQIGEAFGEQGAEKLWSAANVRIYGGGVSDTSFLQRLSDLVGSWSAPEWSRSTGAREVWYARSKRRQPIYDVATLAAMPPGRALVTLSAARPVLVKLQRWFDGPHAARIRRAMDMQGGQ
jgi:type IV secretory pathway TraG/TraD family ATPase VirD4